MNIKVLVPTGALGITYCKKALNKGLKEKPDIIVVDLSLIHISEPTRPY